jgi:sugar O-acyltransferase (sialic acid O-acetyltransferase NeuD family)
MKDIYILGSGGFAKEVHFLIKEINRNSATPIYNFKAFIDVTKESKLFIGDKSYPIIEEESFLLLPSKEICLAIGIGNPKALARLCPKLSGKYSFPNLISPTAIYDQASVKFGEGNIISSGCIFTVDIKVDSFNIFNLNTTVGHDTEIGSFNVINPGANISGGVHIGNCNLIGTNATILQNIRINSNSILGASSLLLKDLDSNLLAVGCPAKAIKKEEV